MVSKTLPSLKSILEPFLSSLRSTWLLFTDFLGSVSCNSSSFNSQKSRVLLSSRCLIFKVLALSISFSLSASLSRAPDYLTTFASVCQALFSDFFRGLFRSPVRFRFSAALLRVFRALSRALRYYTAPSSNCQHLFSCFFIFFSGRPVSSFFPPFPPLYNGKEIVL